MISLCNMFTRAFLCRVNFHGQFLFKGYTVPYRTLYEEKRDLPNMTLKQHTKESFESNTVRNIGIIAHVDAGKTTTTERMLYYSGFSKRLGEVDNGTTVMDYMEQERDRGITINSAAVTFSWKQCCINLIDTPGHVDFAFEVERALHVLDGVIVILDASAGVESQTLNVFQQAQCYNIPSIIYLNKMDKGGASVEHCEQSIRDKLNVSPLTLHIPLGHERSFCGFVDLISMNAFTWNSSHSDAGRLFTKQSLYKHNSQLSEKASSARLMLMEQLADVDDMMANVLLESSSPQDIPSDTINAAVRRATLFRKIAPVFCGSSLKNKGVQPLMDGVIHFLPVPGEVHRAMIDLFAGALCTIAFKVVHDIKGRPLTFLRIYSGSIKKGDTVYNAGQNITEKIMNIFQVCADELLQQPIAVAGEIVAVAGFKQTRTCDILVTNKNTIFNVLSSSQSEVGKRYNATVSLIKSKTLSSYLQHEMCIPSPVFFCSIEPSSVAYKVRLEHALECLQKEDPSLKVEVKEQTGQIILSGMGKLHLEIIHSRLLKEYRIEADLGPLQIAYRETICRVANDTKVHMSDVLNKTVCEKHHYVEVSLSVIPDSGLTTLKELVIDPYDKATMQEPRHYQLKALTNGVQSALQNGTVLGYPIINVSVSLRDFKCSSGASPAMLTACAAQCTTGLVKMAEPQLLEPIMKLEITSNSCHVDNVVRDLYMRRSTVDKVPMKGDLWAVTSMTPLAELGNYASDVRTITSGTAMFSMTFSHYKQVNDQLRSTIDYQL